MADNDKDQINMLKMVGARVHVQTSHFHSPYHYHISFARKDSTGTARRDSSDNDYVKKMAGREIPGYYFGESAS